MNLKKIGKLFTSKFVGTGPSSYKRLYRASVSQRLRNTVLDHLPNSALKCIIWQRDNVYFLAFLLFQHCWPFTSLRLYLFSDGVRLSCFFCQKKKKIKDCWLESFYGCWITWTCSYLLHKPQLLFFILASLLRRNSTCLPVPSLFGF